MKFIKKHALPLACALIGLIAGFGSGCVFCWFI